MVLASVLGTIHGYPKDLTTDRARREEDADTNGFQISSSQMELGM
jgi:hypothetical protein